MKKLFIFFYTYLLFLYDLLLLCAPFNKKPKTLLIVRMDAIGDYILYRNFIEEIKKSKKYSKWSISLCGNEIWRDIAEKFDRKFVNNFIWINKNIFLTDLKYRKKTLLSIRAAGFDTVVCPAFSREFLYGDSIVRTCGAPNRIGSIGDLCNITKFQKLISNIFYTKLIPTKKNFLFEFERNKEFTEILLNKKIAISKPQIRLNKKQFKRKYVIIMPGASTTPRQWSPDNFAKISNYIVKKYKLRIIIGGGKQDGEIAKKIINAAHCSKIKNMTGNLSLSKFIKFVAGSALVISNETSAVHIGVATDVPTICISRGNRFGRFDPYPKNIYRKIFYAYPGKIKKHLDNFSYLLSRYSKDDSGLDINSIDARDVIKLIDKALSAVSAKRSH